MYVRNVLVLILFVLIDNLNSRHAYGTLLTAAVSIFSPFSALALVLTYPNLWNALCLTQMAR